MRDQAAARCRAMILAAGLGTRLRPLTDHIAKPLLPVLGRPLLEVIALRLQRAGLTSLAINTHHRAEQVAAHVKKLRECSPFPGSAFVVFHEPEILGTGGALWNARAFLGQDEFFVLHNGDVLCDLDLRLLIEDHLRHRPLATLLLTDWPEVNSVVLAGDGAIVDIGGRLGAAAASDRRKLTYTGIAAISRRALEFLPAGPSSLIEVLLEIMTEHRGYVRGFAPPGYYWSDLGTVRRYLDVHHDLLIKRSLILPELGPPARFIQRGSGVEVEPGAVLGGFVALGERSKVRGGAIVQDSVVLADAEIGQGVVYRRAVIGVGWVVSQEQNEVGQLSLVQQQDWPPPLEISAITGHGSDRGFWRLTSGAESSVLMQTLPEDEEFERFVAIGAFLNAEGLGAPAILDVDHERRTVLLEDLGDNSLFRLMGGEAEEDRPADWLRLYRNVIDVLVDLQTRGTARMKAGPLAADRLFDSKMLRWETDYFRQRFLQDHLGLRAAGLDALDEDFQRLALTVLKQPLVLMHRDFQSQNILFRDGRVRLVDFQGMRRGPLAYDLMSLLRDCYVEILPAARSELMEHYRKRLAEAGGPQLEVAQLEGMAITAGLQRNMQALGAFAFLSRVRGKSYFERFMPLGLRHLADGLRLAREAQVVPGGLAELEAIVERVMEGESES